MAMSETELEAIRRALQQTGGCGKRAAKLLGISTRTMQRRVKELQLD
jgi:two-component system, NtrC family, response regulator AtoC